MSTTTHRARLTPDAERQLKLLRVRRLLSKLGQPTKSGSVRLSNTEARLALSLIAAGQRSLKRELARDDESR